MEPKKNPQHDLESRRGFHFLIGLAAALLAVILILEIRTFIDPAPTALPGEEVVYVVDDTPITVREVEEPAKPKPKIDHSLPPEVTDVDSLMLPLDDWLSTDDPDPGLIVIDDDRKEKIETLPPILIERVARPQQCAEIYESREQRRCLNDFMQQYVKEEAKLPEEARRNNLQDAVTVSFVIDENGEVAEVQTLRGRYDVLNKEAERVIHSLPVFIPANQQGRKVRMRMNLRINFRY